MKISVAMATYNGARFLDEQMESIVHQSRMPDEVVISDDASTDETWFLLEGLRRRVPFKLILERNERNLGYTGNFEKCMRICTSDIIVLADQDDLWYPQKLSRLEETFARKDKVGLVFSDSRLVDERGNLSGKTLWERSGFSKERQNALRTRPFSFLIKGPVVTGMTMAFQARFLPRLLPIPNHWHHDAWIALLMSLLTELEPLAEPLNAYRVHAAQQTHIPLRGKIPKAPISERARRFQEAAGRYESAAQHIGQWEDAESYRFAIAMLRAKARNKRIRSAAYSRRVSWHLVIGELLQGGYHQYASGFRAAFGDLLRLGNPTARDY